MKKNKRTHNNPNVLYKAKITVASDEVTLIENMIPTFTIRDDDPEYLLQKRLFLGLEPTYELAMKARERAMINSAIDKTMGRSTRQAVLRMIARNEAISRKIKIDITA